MGAGTTCEINSAQCTARCPPLMTDDAKCHSGCIEPYWLLIPVHGKEVMRNVFSSRVIHVWDQVLHPCAGPDAAIAALQGAAGMQ